jgi:tripartite-type tricarboxylate transporter receptor subunit TctC
MGPTSIATNSRKWLAIALVLVPTVLAAGAALAWTDKPVRLVVPSPAGGANDAIARILAEPIAASIGQPVIVDNKPGGGGAIAVQAVLAAKPDGQTLLFTVSNILTETPHAQKTSFNPLSDVKPLAEVCRIYLVLVAPPTFPARNIKELVAYAKANRGKLSYASYSAGTSAHYAGLILNQKEGLDLLHVPYKGAPPAIADVMGGQVSIAFDGLPHSIPYIKSGRLKALAVAGNNRSKLLPEVPTFTEQGYPEIDFVNWYGPVVPAAMDPALAARIGAEFQKAAALPKVRERILELGFEPSPVSTPEQTSASVRADYERVGKLIKTFNLKFD